MGEYGSTGPLLPLGRRLNAYFHTPFILFLQLILHFLFILFHLLKFLIQWLNKATLQRYSNYTTYLLPQSSSGGKKATSVAFLINTEYKFCILCFWLATSFKLNHKGTGKTWIFFLIAPEKAADENQAVRNLLGLTFSRKNLLHTLLPLGSAPLMSLKMFFLLLELQEPNPMAATDDT